MSNIKTTAIISGVIVDKVLFIVTAGLLSTILSTESAAFSNLALILGAACTTFGAYLGARIAKSHYYLHTCTIAGIAFAVSFGRFVLFTINPPPMQGAVHPIGWELIGWSLIIVAGLCAGFFASKGNGVNAI